MYSGLFLSVLLTSSALAQSAQDKASAPGGTSTSPSTASVEVLTFKREVTVGDLMAFASFSAAAIGLLMTWRQLRRDSLRKRAEFIVSVCSQYITDPETHRLFYQLEYGEFEYGSEFHGSESERAVDKLLGYFERIAVLHELGLLPLSDLRVVQYDFVRVYQNAEIPRYFAFLDKLPEALGVPGATFSSFRRVAQKLQSAHSKQRVH